MAAVVSIVVMTASMLVLGWWVWSSLERQESKDEDFRRRLDADDQRAARERGLLPPEDAEDSQPDAATPPASGGEVAGDDVAGDKIEGGKVADAPSSPPSSPGSSPSPGSPGSPGSSSSSRTSGSP